MVEVPQDVSDTPAHPRALCPICGRLAVSDVTRTVRGITLADYSCGRHIWMTKWQAA